MTRQFRAGLAAFALAAFVLVAVAAFLAFPDAKLAAQTAPAPTQKPEMMENCPGLVAADRPKVVPASFQLALNSDQVRITYVGHSTFLIESSRLVRIATDYNDYVRPTVLPNIVTDRKSVV